MIPRQLWLFKLGCWVACATAVVLLVGHIAGPLPPASGLDSQVRAAAASRLTFSDGAERSLPDLLNGFSLVYALLAATIGGVGLAVARRGGNDAALMAAVSRALALVCLGWLAISLAYFFLPPTLLIAVMLVCFALAAVRAPT